MQAVIYQEKLLSGAIAIFSGLFRAVVISTGVEELNHTQKFREVNTPVLGVIVAVVGGTGMITRTGGISVFGSSLAVVSIGIEELNHTKEFREVDLVIAILVGGMNAVF